MELKLKEESENKEIKCIIGGASLDEIKFYEQFGEAHIKVDNNSYFLNPYDSYERERLKEYLGVPEYEFFKETTGNLNWVLYNPKHYHIDKDWDNQKILRFNTSCYDGLPIETPINASSLVGMFFWMRIPENLKFSKLFILDDIIDASLMFAGSRIPEKIDLSPCLKFKNLKYTRYMFYKSLLPKSLVIPEEFDTSKVINMEYMFSQTIIPSGFILNIDTRNTKDLNHMFYNTIFVDKKPIYGPNFVIHKNMNTNYMFDKIKETNENDN